MGGRSWKGAISALVLLPRVRRSPLESDKELGCSAVAGHGVSLWLAVVYHISYIVYRVLSVGAIIATDVAFWYLDIPAVLTFLVDVVVYACAYLGLARSPP